MEMNVNHKEVLILSFRYLYVFPKHICVLMKNILLLLNIEVLIEIKKNQKIYRLIFYQF